MKDTPSISTITENSTNTNTTNDSPANPKDVHFTTTTNTTTTTAATHQQNDENKNIILLDSDNNRTDATTNQIHSNSNNKTHSSTDDDTMKKSMNDSLIDMNTSHTETPLPEWIALNESVLIRPYNMSGVISFIGPTHFQVRAHCSIHTNWHIQFVLLLIRFSCLIHRVVHGLALNWIRQPVRMMAPYKIFHTSRVSQSTESLCVVIS